MLSVVLGNDLKQIESSKVLVVGAGGIGCELLKNLVFSGFKTIHVVDLDTIDLSNLNRQFLFSKRHIKKSKAMIAKETALQFNPNVCITAYHASIFDKKFSLKWFKSFDLVMNALDNVAARRYVNGMCLAASIPLIESGTAGYLGQVSIHVPLKTKCYDCDPKPSVRKTFPVCTIRSTPSESIHCIVWAKSYLFSHLFGKDEDDTNDINEEGDNKEEEIEELKKEALALKALKDGLGNGDHYKFVFEKVFRNDIIRLLKMEELWKDRKKPDPLDIMVLEEQEKFSGSLLDWDQKPWTIKENFRVFKESLSTLSLSLLSQREMDSEATLSFDKDDEAALNFVTAAANLRAHIFGIQTESRFKIKEMAGNIIPAIATTNAIIAGMIVMLSFKVLGEKLDSCKNTYLAYGGDRKHLLTNEQLEPPNPRCQVCSSTYLQLTINPRVATIRYLVEEILQKPDHNGLGIMGELMIEEGSRLLYDIEFDDNLDMTLSDLNIKDASRLTVTNDYDLDPAKNYTIILLLEESDLDGFRLEGSLQFRTRPSAVPEEHVPNVNADKRKRSEEEDLPEGKKLREIVLDDDDTIVI